MRRTIMTRAEWEERVSAFKTRGEVREHDESAYRVGKKRGWIDERFGLGRKRKKSVEMSWWDIRRAAKVAEGYAEFMDTDAYRIARRRGLLARVKDEVFGIRDLSWVPKVLERMPPEDREEFDGIYAEFGGDVAAFADTHPQLFRRAKEAEFEGARWIRLMHDLHEHRAKPKAKAVRTRGVRDRHRNMTRELALKRAGSCPHAGLLSARYPEAYKYLGERGKLRYLYRRPGRPPSAYADIERRAKECESRQEFKQRFPKHYRSADILGYLDWLHPPTNLWADHPAREGGIPSDRDVALQFALDNYKLFIPELRGDEGTAPEWLVHALDAIVPENAR